MPRKKTPEELAREAEDERAARDARQHARAKQHQKDMARRIHVKALDEEEERGFLHHRLPKTLEALQGQPASWKPNEEEPGAYHLTFKRKPYNVSEDSNGNLIIDSQTAPLEDQCELALRLGLAHFERRGFDVEFPAEDASTFLSVLKNRLDNPKEDNVLLEQLLRDGRLLFGGKFVIEDPKTHTFSLSSAPPAPKTRMTALPTKPAPED